MDPSAHQLSLTTPYSVKGIQYRLNTLYNHQSSGGVEDFKKTLKGGIGAYLAKFYEVV